LVVPVGPAIIQALDVPVTGHVRVTIFLQTNGLFCSAFLRLDFLRFQLFQTFSKLTKGFLLLLQLPLHFLQDLLDFQIYFKVFESF